MDAHTFLYRGPAVINDARNLISTIGAHNRNARASIITLVSSVEAFMNDMAQVGFGYAKAGYDKFNPIVLMSSVLLDAESNKCQIKEKVERAYKALTNKNLDRGKMPFQAFSLIVDVRNALTHPKSSILTFGRKGMEPPKEEARLIKKLSSAGFKNSRNNAHHDWELIIENHKFANFAYDACIGVMLMIVRALPYEGLFDGFKALYGLEIPYPKNAPNAGLQNGTI